MKIILLNELTKIKFIDIVKKVKYILLEKRGCYERNSKHK